MVAQRLKENLPNFTYLKINKLPNDWERWLIQTCKENDWYHVQSPLIWREIGLKRGKKDFIGTINKFLDLCYDYYGIPKEVLSAESFTKAEMDWFTHRNESAFFEEIKHEARKRKAYRSRQVCITGASSQVTEIIIMELLQIPLQFREDGLEIRLYDEPNKEKKLTSSAKDAKYCPGPSGLGNCRVVHTLKEALTNVDLVIVLDSFWRKPKEPLVWWLKRNRNAMCALGKGLNMYAPAHCRVIIGSPSNQPICYNATVLASFATKLHVRNIVVVTQDLGREMLKPLSAKINVPLKDLHCPPVWGFVGLNRYVDVRRTLQTHVYKVPGKRLKSTIPQGTEEYELRTVECLVSEEDINDLCTEVSAHKNHSFPQMGRWPCLAKATAIIDLLKVWGLKQEDGNGEILCLGVYSDGTFDIPHGIYWSQPVILQNGFWVPFGDYPIPRPSNINCYYLFLLSIAALYRTKVIPRRYVPPKLAVRPGDRKKVDFEKLAEEIGVPVIRTDSECYNYLKYLAKKELNIDFEVTDWVNVEEPESEIMPVEEVTRENIYCECWRQELKELQKVVFDHSTTTEVEVDLSDNISGSEWSVINPPEKLGSLNETYFEKSYSLLTEKPLPTYSKVPNISSASTVCSCGVRSDGFICECLGSQPKISEEGEKISTEHFYKEQNAQIFEGDSTDVIYADTYEGEKHVSFDADTKDTDDNKGVLPKKLWGKENAIRDEKADMKRKERIARYEMGGEESIEEEEESKGVTEGQGDSTSAADERLQIAMDEQQGLENLRRETTDEDSNENLRGMYSNRMKASIQTGSFAAQKSQESISPEKLSVQGEDGFMLPGAYAMDWWQEGCEEEPISMASLEEVSTESQELLEKESQTEQKVMPVEKKKREGIPLCCLCRCIVPEGLPCCPCGSTTVVEVFKKESVEVIVKSEDDISFIVKYREIPMRAESSEIEIPTREIEEVEPEQRDLPPESFFPFSPKLENKFRETARPYEMTKEYMDSLRKKPEQDVPALCIELLETAKQKLEEEELEKAEMKTESEKLSEDRPPLCEDDEEPIKIDFSDLKLFIPEGLEDWRLTVQRKYRSWFFDGPKIRDECYYDIGIEEVSEDEFEVDHELEQYFEA